MNYNWRLKDGYPEKNGYKVFSCFSCGGGSTMGYKLAGFEVIGNNEIDPKMNECYTTNHSPKYSFLEPIQEFKNREVLPKELYNLDILDGSPPCSSFSTAGSREKDWGKEKKFREGQAKQILDTLFFDFIDLAERLQPKIVIAENVKGLLIGEAIHYVRKINEAFEKAGYYIQHHLLDASKMGVPQKRERVFFVALRKDLTPQFQNQKTMFDQEPELKLEFNEKPICYDEIREDEGNKSAYGLGTMISKYWKMCKPGFSFDTVHPKGSYFNEMKLHPNKTLPTIRASGLPYDYKIERKLFDSEICKAGSYPQDYNFSGSTPNYLIGMSVPPLMTAKIAEQIKTQWLDELEVAL